MSNDLIRPVSTVQHESFSPKVVVWLMGAGAALDAVTALPHCMGGSAPAAVATVGSLIVMARSGWWKASLKWQMLALIVCFNVAAGNLSSHSSGHSAGVWGLCLLVVSRGLFIQRLLATKQPRDGWDWSKRPVTTGLVITFWICAAASVFVAVALFALDLNLHIAH
ncbi:hypothetical protein BIV57_01100 [Mangrovactinospora gilvigrisea]|uniref:Uncharacterized protein n=1 Tax=Mangrovactinospora gilvigrisea TaxID=1428644 RepID=A0A1J7BLI1_9ACTN|nr:hypothetical protein [Mangrovactinospora gilvigrisea]OIV39461.1 hypothetical protein BIV57_01100 [Mangrovactinospora gilvigrisea]